MNKKLCKKLYFIKQKYNVNLSVYHALTSEKLNLMYFPIPKNMCSTLKQAFYQIEHNRSYSKDFHNKHIHDFYFQDRNNYFSNSDLINTKKIKILVVREPIKRFISAYRNRVLDLGDMLPFASQLAAEDLLVKPSINDFIKNLELYRKIVPSIKHHTAPQCHFIGKDLSKFDLINEIRNTVPIQNLIKNSFPEILLKREKSGGTVVSHDEITTTNNLLLESFYREDIKILSPYL